MESSSPCTGTDSDPSTVKEGTDTNVQPSSFPAQQAVPEVSSAENHCAPCKITFNCKESLQVHTSYHIDNLISMWSNMAESSSEMPNTLPSLSTFKQEGGQFSDSQDMQTSRVELGDDISRVLDETHRITGDYPPPSSSDVSPPSFDFTHGNTVPQGPPSSGAYQHSPAFTYSDYHGSFPQSLPQSLNQYASPTLYNYQENLPNLYENEYHNARITNANAPGVARFHPYGRSPIPSPTVKEDSKLDSHEIYDLDSQRFLGSTTPRVPAPQISGGSNQGIWRPVDQHSGNAPPMLPSGSNTPVQQGSSELYGNGVHPHQQGQPLHGMNGSGYPPPVPSIPYHPQANFSSAPSVSNASPNYLAQTPSPNPPAVLSRPASDGPPPPTEFATNVKRPKNFKCETCLKWFTSQGHLKRHYNTTLHKNMAQKQADIKENEKAEASVQSSPQTPSTNQALSQPITSQNQVTSTENSIISPVSRSTNPSVPIENSSLPSMDPENNRAMVNSPYGQHIENHAIPHSGAYHSASQYQPQYAQAHYSSLSSNQPLYADTHGYSGNQSLVPTPSPTMYHGHFSTNPSGFDPSNSHTAQSSFFHAGSTSMSGGGFIAQVSQSQSVSPQQASPPTFPVEYQNSSFPPSNELSVQPSVDTLKNLSLENGTKHGSMSNSLYPSEPMNGTDPSSSPEASRASGTLDTCSDDSVTSSTSATSQTFDPPSEKKTCRTCCKEFTKDCYLNQHINSLHPEEAKDFKCDKCGKRFNNSEVYAEHRAKHSGEKPYKCTECPKQFNHKTDLRRHNCLHSGEKPFKCPDCQKGFIRKDHMVKHMMTHKKKNAAAAANAAVSGHCGVLSSMSGAGGLAPSNGLSLGIPHPQSLPPGGMSHLPGYPDMAMNPMNPHVPTRFTQQHSPNMSGLHMPQYHQQPQRPQPQLAQPSPLQQTSSIHQPSPLSHSSMISQHSHHQMAGQAPSPSHLKHPHVGFNIPPHPSDHMSIH